MAAPRRLGPERSEPRPGPVTTTMIATHQTMIARPTSSTEAAKNAVTQSPHWPAEWNGSG